QHALAGRHDGEGPLGLVAELAQIGRGVAKAQHRLTAQVRPQSAHPAADQVPGHLAQPRIVEVAQIDDVVPHGRRIAESSRLSAITSRVSKRLRGPLMLDAPPSMADSCMPTAESVCAMASLDIELIPLLKDNYAYLLRDSATGTTVVVDPSEARPVLAAAQARGWRITHVLSTHHHWDHTGGNLEIKQATNCMVIGPGYDQERIPGIDAGVQEGDRFVLGGAVAEILFIPGHTRGHIAYWFP